MDMDTGLFVRYVMFLMHMPCVHVYVTSRDVARLAHVRSIYVAESRHDCLKGQTGAIAEIQLCLLTRWRRLDRHRHVPLIA